MKITWLGQAGLLLEKGNTKVLIDPYLSDSCERLNPNSKRRMPIDQRLFDLRPDMILCTHNHMDHQDPDTLERYLSGDTPVTVLCTENGFPAIREFGGEHNYVMFRPGTRWTEKGLRFTAVPAEHSEVTAVGALIEDGERKYYVTGDTLYNSRIFPWLPKDLFAVFLPVNGVGNNMNMEDAAAFAKETGAKWVVPLHWGMFDSLDPRALAADNVLIPKIYQEITFA